ncbi:MAG: hypothetical protein M3383_09420 [Actinomycetota bacterium]|nr:hypothetical protein [Actinomycetota bacterium]
MSETDHGAMWRRRLAVGVSALAIGSFGGGAIGCGDDNDESDIEDAAEEVGGAAEDAGETAEEAAQDAGDAAEDAAEDVDEEVDDDGENDDSGGGVEAGDDAK